MGGTALKAVFIRVNMFDTPAGDAMKPLVFSVVAACTPPDWELECIDDRMDPLPETITADVVALSVETYAAKRAYLLARRYRRPCVLIVMGGFHPTALPEECLGYADAVLAGDAEDTWPAMLGDVQNGTLRRLYRSSNSGPLTRLPEPPGLYRHPYFHIGVTQFSRGCRHSCDFCSIKAMYPGLRQKPLEDVVSELRQSRERVFFFLDDNLFTDRRSAAALCAAIAPLGKKWACQISMDAARDGALLDAMKRAGCVLVLMGFESLCGESLARMGKSANLSADYKQVAASLRRRGFLIYATFVLGYDGDDPGVFERTLRFSMEMGFAVANFNPLIPMPGTPLYDRLESAGRLLYRKWWLSDRYRYGDTAYRPKNISPEELRDGCFAIRTRFYRFGSIAVRAARSGAWRSPTRLALYLALNLVSKKEIARKQGRILGGLLYEADAD